MNFKTHHIGNNLQEMSVDEVNTGTMDAEEATELAYKMISVAEDLLHGCGQNTASDMCGDVYRRLLVLSEVVFT